MGRAEKACDYTEYYHSIIGSGPVSVVKDREEKKKILTIFMECQDKKHFEFTDRMAAYVAVYKIEADEFACKEHNM
jgi:5-nitroimidazole antibiotic resistance protein